MTVNYTLVTTPGRAYLRVPCLDVAFLRMRPSKASAIKGTDWWLEQNNDMPNFIAICKAIGIKVIYVLKNTEDPVKLVRLESVSTGIVWR